MFLEHSLLLQRDILFKITLKFLTYIESRGLENLSVSIILVFFLLYFCSIIQGVYIKLCILRQVFLELISLLFGRGRKTFNNLLARVFVYVRVCVCVYK